MTLLRLTPVLGFLMFMESFPLENYRVVSIQLNGLPTISYPLIYAATLLQSFGIGLVVFGLGFVFTPYDSSTIRKTTLSSAFIGTGAPFFWLSAIGFSANLGEHSPLWSTVVFGSMALAGVSLIVAGLYIRGVKRAGLVSAGLQITGGIIVSAALFWAVLVVTLGPLMGIVQSSNSVLLSLVIAYVPFFVIGLVSLMKNWKAFGSTLIVMGLVVQLVLFGFTNGLYGSF